MTFTSVPLLTLLTKTVVAEPDNAEPPEYSVPISTREELEAINDALDGKYHLVNDIDLSGEDWVPLGGSYISLFTGLLDGMGFSIRNMKITSGTTIGLFSHAKDATIKNISMENVDISVTDTTIFTLVGAICGDIRGQAKISNCHSTGNIYASLSNLCRRYYRNRR